jgi:hypothetical protein
VVLDSCRRGGGSYGGRFETVSTKLGEGRRNATDRRIEAEVQDVSQDIASVLVRSAPYHEYLHLVRTRDGWMIANAPWRPT